MKVQLPGGASALDLSSALIKVGRLGHHASLNKFIAASHLLPETAESSIALRVRHLEKSLNEEHDPAPVRNDRGRKSWWPLFFLMMLMLSYAICINAVLPRMHEALDCWCANLIRAWSSSL